MLSMKTALLRSLVILFLAVGCGSSVYAAPSKSTVLKLGRAALEDGLHEQAEARFREYVAMSSKRADQARGIGYQAEAIFWQGRYAEAEKLLTENRNLADGLRSEGKFVFWTAKCAYELERYNEVVGDLESFWVTYPEHRYVLPSLRLLSRAYLQMEERGKALDTFEKIQTGFAEDGQADDNLLDWATALLEAGRQREGKKVLQQLAEEYPTKSATIRGQLLLAELLMDEGEQEDSFEVLNTLVERGDLEPQLLADAWEQLARQHLRLTNLVQAASALGQAATSVRDEGQRAALDARRGHLLVEVGNLTNGLALFQQSVVDVPDKEEAASMQLALGKTLLDKAHFVEADEAMQHYLEAFSGQPGEAVALSTKAWALWEMDRFGESATTFAKAYEISKEPEGKEGALVKSADAYFADKQFLVARERYNRLIEVFPDSTFSAQARYQMAECFAKAERIDEAIEEFEVLSGLSSNPDVAREAALRSAGLRVERGEWAAAEARYSDALDQTESGTALARALYGRGLVRYRSGEFEGALADFEALVNTHPDDPLAEQAYYLRGWCHYLLANNAAALTICKEFVARYPTSAYAPSVLFWLAEYYYNEENYAEAEAGFASLAETFPEGDMVDAALYWAGRSASDQKEYLRAIDYFAALSKQFPDSPYAPQTRFSQGDALSQLGRFAGAILAFEEVIKKFPDSYLVNRAWGRIGDCQFTLGTEDPQRYRKGMGCYQTILDDPDAEADLRMQASYKIARCHEKLEEKEKALEHYAEVIYAYFLDLEKGEQISDLWLTRSAFGAASLLEDDGQWRQAIRMYERLIEAGVPASAEARERIQKLRIEHWLPFLKEEQEKI